MLQTGQEFKMGGRRWVVRYVTASRAHCGAETAVRVTVPDERTGGTRSFTAHRYICVDISPNTCLEVLAEVAARDTAQALARA